jgi:Zn-dependent protease/CBS domain-containing protein
MNAPEKRKDDPMPSRGGVRIGEIVGISVHADWSLLVIFGLITLGLGSGLVPAWHPDWSPALVWTTALMAALVFFASVLVHELSHAFVGRANGITVRRITLFMFGGLAHMENEPPSWRAELWMALAGPVTSLVLGVGFIAMAGGVAGPIALDPAHPAEALRSLSPLATLLLWVGPVNVMLGVFNLAPGFPLDGGRVLRALLWGATGDLRRATRLASRAGQAFAWLLVATGVAMIAGLRVPFFGTGLLGGLWLVFIGWFLNNAAVLSYQQLLVRESLEDVPVERIMRTHFVRVPSQTLVSTLVDELVMASGQRTFPVEDDGRFVGLVALRDLHAPGRGAWERTTVAEVMTPVERLVTAAPGDKAVDVLGLLGQRDVNQVPVLDAGRLVGLVRREDVLRWLALHREGIASDSGRS